MSYLFFLTQSISLNLIDNFLENIGLIFFLLLKCCSYYINFKLLIVSSMEKIEIVKTFAEVIIGISGVFISILGVNISSRISKSSLFNSNYEFLDSMYQDILKLGIENPHFRDASLTKEYKKSFENEVVKYETYAFLCWNFCETIYDKNDAKLRETWIKVLEEEAKLHQKWFEEQDNKKKFKAKFIDFIKDKSS